MTRLRPCCDEWNPMDRSCADHPEMCSGGCGTSLHNYGNKWRVGGLSGLFCEPCGRKLETELAGVQCCQCGKPAYALLGSLYLCGFHYEEAVRRMPKQPAMDQGDAPFVELDPTPKKLMASEWEALLRRVDMLEKKVRQLDGENSMHRPLGGRR
jgi:hypothetical protein